MRKKTISAHKNVTVGTQKAIIKNRWLVATYEVWAVKQRDPACGDLLALEGPRHGLRQSLSQTQPVWPGLVQVWLAG